MGKLKSAQQRMAIIQEMKASGAIEEIIGEDDLAAALQENRTLLAYDGFEPSGNIHIAQGLLRAITVNKMAHAGIDYIMWVADWFGLMNNKMGGDLERIRTVGEYFIEVWKSCGMDTDHVKFLWASEHMTQDYWLMVVRIGMHNSVDRITRTAQIMGRSDKDKLSAAQIFYPCMQAADIFHLDVDIAQLGMDQRKVNVLAREIAPKLKRKKPICIHHHMLMGLSEPIKKKKTVTIVEGNEFKDEDLKIYLKITSGKSHKNFEYIITELPEGKESFTGRIEYPKISGIIHSFNNKYIEINVEKESDIYLLPDNKKIQVLLTITEELKGTDAAIAKKMSKSNPDSAIFMTDTVEEVNKKFKKAFCPEAKVQDNPVLEYCKFIIFERISEFTIQRPEKFGGDITFTSYAELEKAFVNKEIHPADLKTATAGYINALLEPTRKHFEDNKKAKELRDKVKSYAITK